MSEPTDVQPIVYRGGEPWLIILPGHWLVEARESRHARWCVTGSQTVPAGEVAHVRFRSDGDHHLVRVRRAA